MATLAMTPVRPFGTVSSTPYISSPLAGSSHASSASSRAKRTPSFPQSRPLRPFASISQISSIKPVKIIEPPKNFKTTFILDLTQDEFSRHD